MPRASNTEWYADGLRFECTACGACCTGPPGYVSFTREEAIAMAATLGVSVERFLEDHTVATEAGRSIKEVETEHGLDCVFLDRETQPGKAICSVYDARPTQCRTFPWWPDGLASQRTWKRVAKHCEGIGRGNIVPIEAIRISRDEQAGRDGGVSR